jgi:AcrR family transcriptional regulator
MPEPTRDDIRDKRQAILSAARELFASKGYEETTTAEIARAAGVAVGTIYLYFQTKHEILVEACIALNDEVVNVIRSPELLTLPIEQVPRRIIEATFRTGRENLRFMTYFQVEAQTRQEAERIRAGKDVIADTLDAYFQLVIAQGHIPPFDTAVYAKLLDTLVSASLQQCFAIEQGEREAFYREGVIDVIERLFFGPPLAGRTEAGGASPIHSAS